MWTLDQFIKIKKLLDTNLAVSYKLLSIGPVKYNNKDFIQVDCDRFDMVFSKMYSPENIDFAISKFTILLVRYMASELKNGI